MISWWKQEITVEIYNFSLSVLRHYFGSDNLQCYKKNPITANDSQGIIQGNTNKQHRRKVPNPFSSSVKTSINKCFKSTFSMIVAISQDQSIKQDRNPCMETKIDLGKKAQLSDTRLIEALQNIKTGTIQNSLYATSCCKQAVLVR